MLTKADKWHAFYLGLLYLAAAEGLSRWTAAFPFCLLPAQGEGASPACATFHEGARRFAVLAWNRAVPFVAGNHDAIVAVALILIALFALGLWRSTSRLLNLNQRALGAAAEQLVFVGRSVAAAAEAAAASRRHAVTAERAVLAALGGGCQVPIGAYATVDASTVQISAIIVSPDGTRVIRKKASGEAADAAALGRALGDELLAEGGRQILEAVYGAA